MRSAIDSMIDLAKVFSSEISLRKDCSDKYLVTIAHVSWKENRHDIMARGISGRGESVEQACNNFMNEARGKLLFGDSKTFYGETRPEYICV